MFVLFLGELNYLLLPAEIWSDFVRTSQFSCYHSFARCLLTSRVELLLKQCGRVLARDTAYCALRTVCMDTEISRKFVKKVQSAMENLASVIGEDWDDDLFELKTKIISNGDRHNLLDCLLYGAAQMKNLLVEGQKLCSHNDIDRNTDQNDDDKQQRDCNLMVFGDWFGGDNYPLLDCI